jgi:hypothetical protein
MITITELVSAPSDPAEPFTDRLRLAVAAYLARFKPELGVCVETRRLPCVAR